ncbi:MAG: iron-containing alcohol dehydrogenase [Rhodobacteraceae bacterium]|nr:iron-containing alcohol dehydrogenase [Paracoccaceae bacterium]
MPLIQYLSRIRFDWGAIDFLPEEIRRLGIHSPLLVSDSGIAAAGLVERLIDAAKPYRPVLYLDTVENPTEACLRECLQIWAGRGCDGIIALGGGSCLDLAKAVALVTSHDGEFASYDIQMGNSSAIGRVTPHIAIPTAAGTGAEIGRACVLKLSTGRKSAAVNLNLVADTVICDPQLTMTLPPRLTAATGIDALSHGLEAAISSSPNPPAKAIALDCVRRAGTWLLAAYENGSDKQARWEMMMAALMGGMCLQKGLGAAHAMATPLEEKGHHHGTLIGVLLPHAVRFNAASASAELGEIARLLSAGKEAEDLARWLSTLVEAVGLPTRLAELGFESGEFPRIASRSAESHLNLTNPRSAGPGDYLELLTAAL